MGLRGERVSSIGDARGELVATQGQECLKNHLFLLGITVAF